MEWGLPLKCLSSPKRFFKHVGGADSAVCAHVKHDNMQVSHGERKNEHTHAYIIRPDCCNDDGGADDDDDNDDGEERDANDDDDGDGDDYDYGENGDDDDDDDGFFCTAIKKLRYNS